MTGLSAPREWNHKFNSSVYLTSSKTLQWISIFGIDKSFPFTIKMKLHRIGIHELVRDTDLDFEPVC